MSIPMSFTIAGPAEEATKFKQVIVKEALRHGMSASEYIVEAVADFMRRKCRDNE